MSFFNNKVVVVTGGSDGIGKALIDALIPLGAKMATCGRNYDKLYHLQMQYSNVLLHAEVCDVSKEDECRRFIESTIETFGTIDILINNAGVSMRSLFEDADLEVMRKLMDINFRITSKSASSNKERMLTPALLMRISIVPNVSMVDSINRLHSSSLLTSHTS